MTAYSGWRVWATRPLDQNFEWHGTLADQGFSVIDVPLLAISPVADTEGVQAIKNVILNLDQFQKIIFVSQNAVHAAFNWIEDFWPQLPQGLEYYAVGTKTAASVRAHEVEVVAAESSMDSDELLALEQMQQVWGERVLICRGRGGLPRIGEVLRERGAMVRYCELYERGLPSEAFRAAEQALANEAKRDIVAVFSGETLRNLTTVLEQNNWQSRDLPLVVPGKRVAQLAQSQGFSRVYTAVNASEPAMLEAVQQCMRDNQRSFETS